jgi:hypothetical protein
LNASGRLGSAETAVMLFLAQTPYEHSFSLLLATFAFNSI